MRRFRWSLLGTRQDGKILTARRTIGAAVGDYENDAYNLAGMPINVTSLGYGVTYVYSAAGRALSVTNYTGGTTNKFVSNATYAPPGELSAMTLGSAGIVTKDAYNNRLQPILLSAGVTANPHCLACVMTFTLG